MSAAELSIGIDLGTSNCALAVCGPADDQLRVVPITQVMGAGTIGERPTLPSALYVPHESEVPEEGFVLPWGSERKAVIGAFARDKGALVPDRLITSAKSWLCNHQADRSAEILPWRSESVSEKLSPIEASAAYLSHLKSALEHWQLREDCSAARLQPVLTVPASFDEAARTLTRQAAEAAGLHDFLLLEEPQAAFYAWIAAAQDSWREQVQPGDVVLVCDVGGGTADFSLIAVREQEGRLCLDRLSVGAHILLGGDNMDLALAYTLRAELADQGTEPDDWQFLALVHAVRAAKERLFQDPELREVPISLPTRSASLFAGTLTTALKRDTLLAVVLDGFFPLTAAGDRPAQRSSIGLQEYGLPFAADPAVSRHLAGFLSDSLKNVQSDATLAKAVDREELLSGSLLRPTAVLFNGGIFHAAALRGRVMELLRGWFDGAELRELQGADPDLAVAKGAAFYGGIRRRGEGIRIKSGIARSYYLGLEASMPAVPGYTPPVQGLCVAPQGMEEGSELQLSGQEFGLVTGEPVEFRFFSSSVRAGDALGTRIVNAEKELDETAHLAVTLDSDTPGEVVPVELHSVVTEVGTLELWLHHTLSNRKWKLEFNVRGTDPAPNAGAAASDV